MSDTDIFREVEEDLQRERFEKLWKKYGSSILGIIGLVVIGFGFYQLWQYRARSLAEALGTRLIAAQDLARDGKADDARAALTALSAEAPGAYRVLAQLQLAGADAKAGKINDAVKAYDAIGKDGAVDKAMRDFAQIQAAALRVDQADWTEMQNRLTTFSDVGSGWRHAARELLGLSAMKAGKVDDAESQFQLILSDRASPGGVAQRAQMMLDVLLAGNPKAAPVTATVAKPADATKTPDATKPVDATKPGQTN